MLLIWGSENSIDVQLHMIGDKTIAKSLQHLRDAHVLFNTAMILSIEISVCSLASRCDSAISAVIVGATR